MTFEHPLHAVAALVGCAVVATLVVWAARNRRRGELVYSDLATLTASLRPQPSIERILLGMFLLGLGALGVAAGAPQVRVPVLVHNGAVFVCVDTSGSMASGDVSPTRASAAAAAARAFVAATPRGTRVGLIAFSGFAAVVQPLTTERNRVDAAIAALPAPNGATAIGDALALAAQSLPAAGHRAIVVITDGVNNRGVDPLAEARLLGARHVAVYTVGIGTNGGGLIPGTDQEATIDEGALRAYAHAAGGSYARAGTADALRAALAKLGRTTAVQRVPLDASFAFAVAAAIAILAAGFGGFVLGRIP